MRFFNIDLLPTAANPSQEVANAARTGLGIAPLTMITADNDLLIAAPAEGLTVDDPETH